MTCVVAVLDTETTGTGPEDQIVEMAVVRLGVETYRVGDQTAQVPRLLDTWSSLVRPGVPVSARARAAHHLTDEELATAPSADELLCDDWPGPVVGDVLAAHCLEFDVRMMDQTFGGRVLLPDRRVCTLQCARHLFPNEESHSNQALRYSLGLALPASAEPPHRALPDALLTGLLLARMLSTHTVEELESLTGTPVLLPRCPVGKYRGRPWEDVDTGMLRWIIGRDFSSDVKHTARHHLGLRGGTA